MAQKNPMIKRYEHTVGMMGELSYHLPEVLTNFDDMRLSITAESALDVKTKTLIALGVAIATGGEGWIEHFVVHALRAQADPQEIMEIIGVALLMGGGSVMAHCCEACEMLQAVELRDRTHQYEMVHDSINAVLREALTEEEWAR